MKLLKLLSLLLFVLMVQTAIAQTDVRTDLPGDQDIHTGKDLPENLPHEKNMEKITKAEIPSKLLKALQKKSIYKGWEEALLYLDKNTSLYMLYLQQDSTIINYGFDKDGKVVTFDEYTKHIDQQ